MSGLRHSDENWTILKVLNWSSDFFKERQIDSPRLDAELLLAEALGLERLQLYTQFDRPLDPQELARFKALIIRRARERVPVAYLLGRREFWSIELKVSPAVLIPRPDTELLVELALERAKGLESLRIIDVGTGSGAIALALASELPQAQIIATELSPEAATVARENATHLQLDQRVKIVETDLLQGIDEPAQLIVSNPPYIATSERPQLSPEVLHEPSMALFAQDEGLALIQRLALQAHALLLPGGALLCEIGMTQGQEARQLFESAGFEQVEVHQDYGKRDRVVTGLKAKT